MRNNIVFLGCTQDYPYCFSACNTKVELISRGLILQGDRCCIINSIVGSKLVKKKTESQNDYQINHITYPFYANQLISWICNIKKLYQDLQNYKSDKYKNILILEAPDYHIYLLYIILGRLLGYKISIIAHEWLPTIKSTHILRKPSVWLYATTFGYLADGIMPISRYIDLKTDKFKKKKMRLPILAEFNNNEEQLLLSTENIENGYFLYCAFAAYFRVITFIADTYKYFCDMGGKQQLIMVLSGSQEDINKVVNYLKRIGINDRVLLRSKLPYNELTAYYKKAIALLIPLCPNSEQDKARFSQKIAEYLSSYRPIISTNVGEINEYFTDKQNIILASEYSIESFCNALQFAIKDYEIANKIGYEGRLLGEKEFDFKKNGKKLHLFFNEL